MSLLFRSECIGDDFYASLRSHWEFMETALGEGGGDRVVGKMPSPWWVAEIAGRSGRYRWERRFLRGQRDYSKANSVGSRGVFFYYLLEEGKAYEIKERVTWGRTERYFCRIEAGALIRMTDAEIEAWLPRA